eukprot:TRINITY_DN903_c1_g1_i4.p1 TRINITY_DN903_c1_g1~~TRINITY_DN903_c1_g1_i4.p1  ORF type:complete len:301 (+),score=92.22 TRINITY_DN903_c1_g1_i4:612-1514(+)
MEENPSPFRHRISMSGARWLRTYALTLILFPLRVLSVLIFVILYWMAASITLYGDPPSPLEGWRKRVKIVGVYIGRIAFRFMGLIPEIRGLPDPAAPVFVIAPHSSFFDAFVVFWLGMEIPSIVNRYENRNIPFIGKCIRMTESIFVTREAANSRQATVQEIVRRVRDPSWPKMALFPEGSTSNRTALMPFKKGAFVSGSPVQPVVIRYPNAVDTVTWTWDQPHGAKSVVWLTLTQIYTKVIVEFLPLYTPSEEEAEDPLLFGNNVRTVMAKSLGVPLCQDSFEEVKRKYAHCYKSKKKD